MKFFISILLLSLCSLSSAAEYGQLTPDTDYDTLRLEAGDVFEVLAFDSANAVQSAILIYRFVSDNGGILEFTSYHAFGVSVFTHILVGPGNMTAGRHLHYKLTRAPNPQPAAAATTEN